MKYLFLIIVAALPFLLMLMFKLKIGVKFWGNMEKPHLIDYLVLGGVLVFCYFSFNHGDLTATATHGKNLVEVILKGDFLGFYDYCEGTAAYLLPSYIIFAVWSLPVFLINAITGTPMWGVLDYGSVNSLLLMWYKLLPTLFYLGTAFLLYKIAINIRMSPNKAKWVSFIWMVTPIATFSQFVFGQYDSIGVFFTVFAVYYYLKKKPYHFSILIGISATFKMFPLFIFFPLILLVEKRVIHLIKYAAIALSGIVLFNLIFINSPAFNVTRDFNDSMMDRLFAHGLSTSFGTVSFFILAFIAVCVYAYIHKQSNEFEFEKWALYIPLVIYSVFFSFVLWHPQWVIVVTPFIVLAMFQNNKIKTSMFINIGLSISYICSVCSAWINNVDANMINLGFIPKIFGYDNPGNSLNYIFNFLGGVTPSLYITIFVSLLLVNLVLKFPSKSNLTCSQTIITKPLEVERELIWILGLSILIFVVPALYVYFRVG